MNDRPEIVLVAAVARNGVIGRDNAMPWHVPADLRRFKRMTVGQPVLMGRRTHESIGRPLPGRHNIVLTRTPGWTREGVTVAVNLAEAIAAAGLDPRTRAARLMVIGGADLYRQTLPMATRLELTEIDLRPEGDTHFPEFDRSGWREVARERHAVEGDVPAYDFVTLVRA